MTESQPVTTTRGGIDMPSIAAAVGRSLGALLVIAALVAGLAFVVFDRVPAMYFSEARLVVGIDESDPERRAKAMAGEVQLVRSQDIAQSVVTALMLAASPEYRSTGADTGLLRRALVALGLARDLRSLSPEERVLALYDENLVVNAVSGTAVIRIGFWSADPTLAARAANAVSEAYRALRQSATDEAVALRTEIGQLEQALRDGEARAAALRAEIAALPAALDDAARSALIAERDAAIAAITASRADAAAIREPDASGTLTDVAAYRDDAAVRSLIAERQALREELAREMLARPLGNPRLAEIVARLGAIQMSLATEGERIAASLEADADRAASRLAEIEARLRESVLAAAAARALAEVEAKVAADHAGLDAALNRQAALGQGTALPTSVRVLAAATVPAAPHWPDVAFIAGLAFVAALAAGIVVVILRDIVTGRAFRQQPFAPLAGIDQPAAAAGRMRRVDEAETQRAGPAEPTIAPLAGTETSLREVADSIAGRRRIIVTLAEESDAEGRPLAAVALVRALSGRDRTVILVDLQSDGANESAMGEIAELSGFTDLLAGEASFSQAIFRDRRSRAHFIPLGSRPLEPEQLSGEHLSTLLTALDHTYDHVVIDCPDEAIARMAPPADAALVVSDYGSADPRTVRAVSHVARASDAYVFHLLVEPNRRPPEAARAA